MNKPSPCEMDYRTSPLYQGALSDYDNGSEHVRTALRALWQSRAVEAKKRVTYLETQRESNNDKGLPVDHIDRMQFQSEWDLGLYSDLLYEADGMDEGY